MANTLVSCIVPVYNGERYLREALDSILGQTYRPLEIIVADDASSDDTAALVANYEHAIRYLFQPNAGTAAACNLGLGAAQGEFIAFLAADDLWNAEKLERQMTRFRVRPELAGSVSYIQNFWSPELRQDEIPAHDKRLFNPVPGYVPQTLLAPNALFKTFGVFNSAFKHADAADWFLRVREHGAVIELLPDVLASTTTPK